MSNSLHRVPAAFAAIAIATLFAVPHAALAQQPTRDALVRDDKDKRSADDCWVYNDLAVGLAQAKKDNKPLLVVLRCIPCKACAGFDEAVARRDPKIADLMEKFVCVRLVQTNGLDLALFQFDYDMSFAAFFMNADRAIFGRFGTISNRTNPESDISLAGFREALAGALELHAGWPANREALSGKIGKPPEYAAPEEYPALKSKYKPQLDYTGKVAESCIHCHQVREAQRKLVREKGSEFTDDVLWPYPMPKVLGLVFDAEARSKVKDVLVDSVAEKAGFKAGDELLTLGGQPLLSIADVQWVLHAATEPSEMTAEVLRGDEKLSLTLPLAAGWRRGGDIAWRATSWDLRRMATGGLSFDDLPNAEREKRGLDNKSLALRVKNVPWFGEHAAAQKAGFKKDDVIVEFDNQRDRMNESELLVFACATNRAARKCRSR